MNYSPKKFPAAIPITAERHTINIGCFFLKAKKHIIKNTAAEIYISGVCSTAFLIPSGKNTVVATDTTAAAISPITPGFNPVSYTHLTAVFIYYYPFFLPKHLIMVLMPYGAIGLIHSFLSPEE